MRKRSIALALCALLLAGILPPGAGAAGTATFVVEAPETLPAVGEEFTVTVRMENNPGYGMVQFYLLYDNASLRCTKIEPDEKMPRFAAYNPDNKGKAAVGAGDIEQVNGDGVIALLTFEVLKETNEPDFSLEEFIIGDMQGEPMEVATEFRRVQEKTGTSSRPSTSSKPSQGTGTSTPEPPEEQKPEAETVTFTDLAGHWGESYAVKAAQEGLFKGYADGSFHPDEAVSRAQFVTVLWRLAGAPAEERETPFADIADQYIEFRQAIAWGYHQGYVRGTAEDAFSPEGTLTRQEAMTILFRYAGEQSGMELMFTSVYDSQFQDSADIAPWAKSAMYWGVYRELIQGTGGGNLSPTGSASRAQIAKIMSLYQEKFGKEEN